MLYRGFQPQGAKQQTLEKTSGQELESSHAASDGSPPGPASRPARDSPGSSIQREAIVFAGFQGRARPTWMVSRPPGQSPGQGELGTSRRRVGCARAQVLNSRKPPKAVPGGLVCRTEPWVTSTHTRSPFCSSAMAKAVAAPPPRCSSAAPMGVRW